MDILAIAAVAFTVAGFVKGVVGFGFPIITLIILTLTIGLLDALAIIVFPTIVTNIWQGLSGPFLKDIARRCSLRICAVPIVEREHQGVAEMGAAACSPAGRDQWHADRNDGVVHGAVCPVHAGDRLPERHAGTGDGRIFRDLDDHTGCLAR